MLENIKGIISIVLILIGFYIFYEAWDQTCLGIFQDKVICEIRRNYKADFERCAEKSWDVCDKYPNKSFSQAYSNCIDNVRCRCMRRANHSSCSAP